MGVELPVILRADILQQIELRLQMVDVALLVAKQFLEQIHRHVILFLTAAGARFHVEGAGGILRLQIAFEDFLDVLADHQGVEMLHVGKALEEDDARHQLVGVMHLLDRFLPLLLGELGVAPIVEQPVMQPVLIDGGELAGQRLIEILDDPWIALHSLSSSRPFALIMTCSLRAS